jgi:hypothetical protein
MARKLDHVFHDILETIAREEEITLGKNHAWSNRSNRPCTIAFSSHDAA